MPGFTLGGVEPRFPRRGLAGVDFEELLSSVLMVCAIAHELDERVTRLEVRLLEEQLAHPPAER